VVTGRCDRAVFEHCILVGTTSSCFALFHTSDKVLEFNDCMLLTRCLCANWSTSDSKVMLTLRKCTGIFRTIFVLGSRGKRVALRVQMDECLIDTDWLIYLLSGPLEDLPRTVTWKGQGNLISQMRRGKLIDGEDVPSPVTTVAEWRNFWGASAVGIELDSLALRSRLRDTDRPAIASYAELPRVGGFTNLDALGPEGHTSKHD
jgi:hypothetical protein